MKKALKHGFPRFFTGETRPTDSDSSDSPGLGLNDSLVNAKILPNNLEAYAGDSMGLDRARRDCRLEMVKIVTEVRGARNPG